MIVFTHLVNLPRTLLDQIIQFVLLLNEFFHLMIQDSTYITAPGTNTRTTTEILHHDQIHIKLRNSGGFRIKT